MQRCETQHAEEVEEAVRETPGFIRAALTTLRRIPLRVDAGLRSCRLLDRSRLVRKLTDGAIRGIKVEPIPACLGEGQRAIVVSNYPSVSQAMRAVMKVGCRLPGPGFRMKGIGRQRVVTGANAGLRALGVDQHIFPALKDQSGKYVLESDTLKGVLAHLDGEGSILWLSITGNTRGGGLLERDLRTGAALFSLKKKIPIVPMGLVTIEKQGKLQVKRIRFGEPINVPEVEQLNDFGRGDFLVDVSRLMMCQIAALLPPGQRGDFEDVEEKLREMKERLDVL